MMLYLIPVIVFGLISVYTDIRSRVIKNKLIATMLITAVIMHAYHLFFFPDFQNFMPNFIINLGFSVFVGVLLWVIYIWPAGDAKLFIAYSALLPLTLFSSGSPFISFEFLINTFVPVFFVMFVFLLIKSKPSEIKRSLKFTFDPYRLFSISIVILGFLWFIIKAFSFLGVIMNYFIILVLLFVIIEIFDKVVPVNLEYLYVFLAVTRLIIDYRTVFTFGYSYEFLALIFAFIIVRYFVIDLGFLGFTTPKKIKDLEPGMCLAEGIAESKEKGVNFEKRRIIQFSLLQSMTEKRKVKFIHGISFDGLTKDDVKKIKKLRKSGKIPFDEVMIHTSTPFAFFLLVGAVLTITLQANFVTYLQHMFF